MEYLFSMCHYCGISPNEPLKLGDFFQLVTDIDGFIEAQNKANEG